MVGLPSKRSSMVSPRLMHVSAGRGPTAARPQEHRLVLLALISGPLGVRERALEHPGGLAEAALGHVHLAEEGPRGGAEPIPPPRTPRSRARHLGVLGVGHRRPRAAARRLARPGPVSPAAGRRRGERLDHPARTPPGPPRRSPWTPRRGRGGRRGAQSPGRAARPRAPGGCARPACRCVAARPPAAARRPAAARGQFAGVLVRRRELGHVAVARSRW